MSKRVSVIEWRHAGHRLFYLRGIVEAAQLDGHDIQIITTRVALGSHEWHVHLRDSTAISVKTLTAHAFTTWKLPRLFRSIRKEGRELVLPEADRFLHIVLLAKLCKGLPKKTTIIVMRPPSWDSVYKMPTNLYKVVLLRILAATRSITVLLLEDQLASGRARVWRWPLSSMRLRLDDPADYADDAEPIPPEMGSLDPKTKVIAIVGAIDDRKQVPLVLDSWATREERDDLVLVIAGPQASEVRMALASHPATKRRDVVMIDRYLALKPVVDRATALLVLFDGGLSSATQISAAQAGRWVITPKTGRPALVAGNCGFGVSTELTPSKLRVAIDTALQKETPPVPMALSGPTEFGRRVLGFG